MKTIDTALLVVHLMITIVLQIAIETMTPRYTNAPVKVAVKPVVRVLTMNVTQKLQGWQQVHLLISFQSEVINYPESD